MAIKLLGHVRESGRSYGPGEERDFEALGLSKERIKRLEEKGLVASGSEKKLLEAEEQNVRRAGKGRRGGAHGLATVDNTEVQDQEQESQDPSVEVVE